MGENRPGMAMTIKGLRDPVESTAKMWLTLAAIPAWLIFLILIVGSFGTILIWVGLFLLGGYFARLFALASIKINAVRCSPKQFPEIYKASIEISQRLGIKPPDIYILQESIWNAFAAVLAGKRLVVLYSGAIDSLLLKGDIKQVYWLLGHEIGHHAAGHFGFWRNMISFGGWLPWILLWYHRRGELTCDRIGLYAVNNLSDSFRAMCNMTVGAQLADQIDIDEIIAQWTEHKGEFFVKYRILYSTHPPHLWRLEQLLESANQLKIPSGA